VPPFTAPVRKKRKNRKKKKKSRGRCEYADEKFRGGPTGVRYCVGRKNERKKICDNIYRKIGDNT